MGDAFMIDGRTAIERDRAAFVKQVGWGTCKTVLMGWIRASFCGRPIRIWSRTRRPPGQRRDASDTAEGRGVHRAPLVRQVDRLSRAATRAGKSSASDGACLATGPFAFFAFICGWNPSLLTRWAYPVAAAQPALGQRRIPV